MSASATQGRRRAVMSMRRDSIGSPCRSSSSASDERQAARTWSGRRGVDRNAGQRQHGAGNQFHFTLTGAFGSSPNISGLYIASTRVAAG
jgi:hypothetical protein